MSKFETLGKLLYRGFLPILLADELPLLPTVEQISLAGIEAVEISALRREVLTTLGEIKRAFPTLAIGVCGLLEDGRLRDYIIARGTELPSIAEAVEAGADFLSSSLPFREETYRRYRETHVLMPGVDTAGEAVLAVDLGAALVRFMVPHLFGDTGVLRALDLITHQSLPICTTGPVRFELQPGYITAGSMLCGVGFDTIMGPDYHPMQRAFDEDYVQEALQRFLLPIDRARRTLYENVPFASRDPWAIAKATGRCFSI